MKSTYTIPAANHSDLKNTLDALNKRAAKLGCAPVTLTVIREYSRECENPQTRLKYGRAMMEIEVEGESPKLEGWQLLAVVEPQENGENLVRCVPGSTVPESYRTTDTHCDHCNTNRRRKEVFVLGHEDGHTVQVGRTCISDFLGHISASTLAARAEYVMSAFDEVKHSKRDGYRSVYAESISQFLGTVAICIRRFGWLSKSKAGEDMPTAEIAWMILSAPNMQEYIKKNNLFAEDRDQQLAKEALIWATGLTGKTDYEYNLGVACRQTYVTYHTAGIVASAIAAYQRTQERVEKTKKLRKHVGVVGKRQDFEATVKRLRYFDSDWGVRTMCLFEDASGNHLIWWASRELNEIEEGDTLKIKATVKEHSDFNGTPQTIIQRCKILS